MKVGPFIRSKNNTRKMMSRFSYALIPIIIFGFYKNGILPYIENEISILEMFKPLIFILLGGISTYITELICVRYILRKKNEEFDNYMENSYSTLPGILLSLILPLDTPIWLLLLGGVVTIVFGRMLSGGFGKNIFNPTLIGKIFVVTIYSSAIVLYENMGTYETLLSPYNIKDYLLGFIPGSIGETSALLCIAAYIYLAFKRVIKKKIPVIYVATVFILTWIIGRINGLGVWYPLYQILSGGLLFAAVFIATDPVTSPVTPIGQFLYAVCLGILTVFFRYLTPSSDGVLVSVLIMNIFVSILDIFGSRARGRIAHYSLIFITIIATGLLIANYIGNSYKNEKLQNLNIEMNLL